MSGHEVAPHQLWAKHALYDPTRVSRLSQARPAAKPLARASTRPRSVSLQLDNRAVEPPSKAAAHLGWHPAFSPQLRQQVCGSAAGMHARCHQRRPRGIRLRAGQDPSRADKIPSREWSALRVPEPLGPAPAPRLGRWWSVCGSTRGILSGGDGAGRPSRDTTGHCATWRRPRRCIPPCSASRRADGWVVVRRLRGSGPHPWLVPGGGPQGRSPRVQQRDLDEGTMWPTDFALTKLTTSDEARTVALVQQAIAELIGDYESVPCGAHGATQEHPCAPRLPRWARGGASRMNFQPHGPLR